MDWFRKRREIAPLQRRLTEIKEEVDLIHHIRERVGTIKALLVRQKQLVLRDLEPLIKDREELLKTIPTSNKLEFSERTASYKALRDSIVSDNPIKDVLKPLILKELKGVEFCLMLEKESISRRITILSLWTRNPCILFVIVTAAFLAVWILNHTPVRKSIITGHNANLFPNITVINMSFKIIKIMFKIHLKNFIIISDF